MRFSIVFSPESAREETTFSLAFCLCSPYPKYCTPVTGKEGGLVQTERRIRECRLELLAANHLRRRSAIKILHAFQQYLYRLEVLGAVSIIQNFAREFLARIAFAKLRRSVV